MRRTEVKKNGIWANKYQSRSIELRRKLIIYAIYLKGLIF
jgi:hypothetical protein